MMALNPVPNVLYIADSYKITHHMQYPPGTTFVYSYFESRGGKYPEVCFFGLQYIIKQWMLGPVVTHAMIDEAKEFFKLHFSGQDLLNESGWRYIVDKHNGHLPLRIKAVPEGTILPVKNVLFTVENTDPEVPWLTNWFETLLVQVWYPTTVCTNSHYQKRIIARYLAETADSMDGLRLKLHDFGYRGATSVESAAIGDAAHLVNFIGTDNIAGLHLCRKFYGEPMAAFSIPAAEHSTMTAWGRDQESQACKHMLEKFPVGAVSVVSDSYDVFACCEKIWGGELKPMVIERGRRGACLVIRPDSGEPKTVLLKVLTILEENFPVTKNSKGYKMLPPYLRLIQGDGVSYETICGILESFKVAGWSADNLVFGSGGALLQQLDRDTQKCAFKCSAVVVNGEERAVFKQPITDQSKNSKKGRLTLELRDGKYVTIEENKGNPDQDLLVTVFEDGKLMQDYSLQEIRNRAEIDLFKNTGNIPNFTAM